MYSRYVFVLVIRKKYIVLITNIQTIFIVFSGELISPHKIEIKLNLNNFGL